jgi:hypothetical protein
MADTRFEQCSEHEGMTKVPASWPYCRLCIQCGWYYA